MTKRLEYEYLVCAANYFEDGKIYDGLITPRNKDTGFYVACVRHGCGIAFASELMGIRSIHAEQGFISNLLNFYTREEAMKMALINNQIRDPQYGTKILYSEHLY